MSGGNRAARSAIGLGLRARGRFPRRVYRLGEDPDPRFTLANERTYLAWVRTALALIAGGVAVEALEVPIAPAVRIGIALTLLVTGLALPVIAWIRWARTEAALRLRRPLPSSSASLPLAVVIALIGAAALGGLVWAGTS